jgi:hypothetical protein
MARSASPFIKGNYYVSRHRDVLHFFDYREAMRRNLCSSEMSQILERLVEYAAAMKHTLFRDGIIPNQYKIGIDSAQWTCCDQHDAQRSTSNYSTNHSTDRCS